MARAMKGALYSAIEPAMKGAVAALLAVYALLLHVQVATAQTAAASRPATGDVWTDADARAVRSVVQAQLDALAAGNGERAYGYAAPAIQAQFGDVATFMAMVGTGYPMLISPERLAFRLARPVEGGARQTVQVRDSAGRLWLATYLLVRTKGVWRIGGCAVVPDSPKSST